MPLRIVPSYPVRLVVRLGCVFEVLALYPDRWRAPADRSCSNRLRVGRLKRRRDLISARVTWV